MSAPQQPRVQVVVADDHPVFREGIVRAFSISGTIEVIAEADNGNSALESIRQMQPQVAVLDYRLPGLDGISVLHAVARDKLETRVILLSAVTDSNIVFKALEEGASGYIDKGADRQFIIDAVLRVASGGTVIPGALAGSLAQEIRSRAAHDAPILSERERQVLRAIAEGKSAPQISRELFIGVSTVKTHIQRLYEKLEVSDRGAAVAEAMRRGLLE